MPLARELCVSCFEDAAYFEEIHALTERRLAAARRHAPDGAVPLHAGGAGGGGRARRRACTSCRRSCWTSIPRRRPRARPCVLFVGRLVEAKGVWDAVEAWRQSGLELPLVLVGDGAAARASGGVRARHERIEITGWLDRRALSGVYARAQALLLPSRWQEPFGIVGLEALTFGVPVAAWESGGVGEWHPGPGLARWGDVPALGRALREVAGRRLRLRPRLRSRRGGRPAARALRTARGSVKRGARRRAPLRGSALLRRGASILDGAIHFLPSFSLTVPVTTAGFSPPQTWPNFVGDGVLLDVVLGRLVAVLDDEHVLALGGVRLLERALGAHHLAGHGRLVAGVRAGHEARSPKRAASAIFASGLHPVLLLLGG